MLGDFSPAEAAFSGFKLIRERPKLFFGWCLAYLGMLFALGLGLGLLVFAVYKAVPGVFDDSSSFATVGVFAIAIGLVLLSAAFLLVGVWTCAIYRAVLDPQDQGLAYLQLGGDELRVALVSFILAGIGLAGVFLAAAAGGAVTGLAGDSAAAQAGVALLIWPLLAAAGFALATKLSFATVLTYARKRIVIAESWRFTRGRFWPVLGMLLLVALYVVGVILVATAASYLFGLEGRQAAARAPDQTLLIFLVVFPLQIMFGVVQFVVGAAPAATAYKKTRPIAADVFN